MQKGRSLVEMLGVLAIMGLIGLTAFQGFEYVMRKNTTENIWKELLLRASDLASKSTGTAHFGAGFNNNAFGVNWNVVEVNRNVCNVPAHTTLVGVSISMPADAVRDALVEKARGEDAAISVPDGMNINQRRKLSCVYWIAPPGAPVVNLLDAPNQAIPANATGLVFGFRKSR